MRKTIPSSAQSLFQSESKNSKLMKTDILDKDFLNSLIIHEEKERKDIRNHYCEGALDM